MPHPAPTSCPVVTCGNSATINNSIIEALDTDGKAAQKLDEPFKLKRGSLQGAKDGCAGVANLSLEVRDGGLVGVAGDGVGKEVKCSGAALAGAKFTVTQRSLTTPAPADTIVQIAKIGSIDVWMPAAGAQAKLPTYDLIAVTPNLSKGVHLCPGGQWGDAFADLPPRFKPWLQKSQHAVLVQGETYHPDGAVDDTGANWFNIGCAGSAIAKMRLLGLDPMKPPAATDAAAATAQRQATLKMLTAKYCGPDSWTKDGTRILIRGNDKPPPTPPGHPNPGAKERIGPIESQWGGSGAMCISHLRLWSQGSTCSKEDEVAAVEKIRTACGIPACDEKSACESGNAADPTAVWRTCTVNHISHAPH